MWRFSYLFSAKLLLLIIAGCFAVWPSVNAQINLSDFAEGCQELTDATQLPSTSLSTRSTWCFTLNEDNFVSILADSSTFDIWIELYSEASCEADDTPESNPENAPCLVDADDDSSFKTNAILNTSLKSGRYLLKVGSYDAKQSTDQYQILMTKTRIDGREQENCIVNTVGQDWHPSGGGGFELEDDPNEILRKTVEIPLWVSNVLESSHIDESLKVVLIVLDDFSSKSAYEMLNNPLTNQIETPSHGDVVIYHLQKIDIEYSAHFGTPRATFHDLSTSIDLQPGINVVPLSLGSYDELDQSRTGLVAARLRSMMESLLAKGANRIVVNLSFSFIPCEVLERIEARRLITQPQTNEKEVCENVPDLINQAFWQGLVLDQRDTGALDILGKLFKHYVELNSNTQGESNFILFVAAAGNIPALTELLYPGGWAEVVSVTATDKSGDPAPYASPGEISLPGGCFRYGDTNYLYAGTSFATPLMSYISALHFLMPEPPCPFSVVPPPVDAVPAAASNDVPSFLEVLENCG